jgi:hypothetical protein
LAPLLLKSVDSAKIANIEIGISVKKRSGCFYAKGWNRATPLGESLVESCE